MTTVDKAVLAALIVTACGVGIYQYWHMLEPLRYIATVLTTGRA